MDPYKYSDSEALAFIDKYGEATILGEKDFWFSHTLSEYVADKGVGWPQYGIIVAPEGRNTLVWYDAAGRLVVIDLTGYQYESQFVSGVKKPEYMSDPQYLELWQETLDKIVPKPMDIKQILMLTLGLGIVVYFIKKG